MPPPIAPAVVPAPNAAAAAAGTPPAAPGAAKPPAGAPPAAKPGITPPAAKPDAGQDPLKAAADAAVKKYKLVVDGKEEEVDEKELISRAQKATGAEKRFEEAAKLKRYVSTVEAQVERLISTLRDPQAVWDALQKLGHKPREIAENYLLDRVREEQLTPEQKKVRDAEKILQADEERKRTEEKTVSEKRRADLEERFANDYSNQVTAALQSGNLPKSEWTVKMMAYFMHQGLVRNIPLTADDVVPLVRKYFVRQINDLFSQTDGDALLELLGEGVATKIRTADLARLKNPRKPVPPELQPKGNDSKTPPQKKTVTMDEFRERSERIKRGEAV